MCVVLIYMFLMEPPGGLVARTRASCVCGSISGGVHLSRMLSVVKQNWVVNTPSGREYRN